MPLIPWVQFTQQSIILCASLYFILISWCDCRGFKMKGFLTSILFCVLLSGIGPVESSKNGTKGASKGKSKQHSGRIVGGREVQPPHALPWQAALVAKAGFIFVQLLLGFSGQLCHLEICFLSTLWQMPQTIRNIPRCLQQILTVPKFWYYLAHSFSRKNVPSWLW